MRWNVSVLEAMATWREYYKETVIPQGTMYDYVRGVMASSRDIAQQALPLCHTNPALAKSTLRWLMKRMLPSGEIVVNDEGFGWSPPSPQITSDQQLYFFLLLSEYLRVTGDSTILSSVLAFYPPKDSHTASGLDHVRKAFLYFRDRVGVGAHGIVRLWNSDWNDMFYYWPTKAPYNTLFHLGESHMNSSMAIVILGDIATTIDAAGLAESAEMTGAMREFRTQLYRSWLSDLGTRSFSRRAWTDPNTPVGEDDMWLEPQSYALLIPEFDTDRKRQLFAQLRTRLLDPEVLGARQIEKPVVQPNIQQGARENGGFWYALHGPLVLGVATFDSAAAEELLTRMTFAHFSRKYPNYWTGRWSASDCLDSSLLSTQGLSSAQIYCAHPHAWPLYCYLRLRPGQRVFETIR